MPTPHYITYDFGEKPVGKNKYRLKIKFTINANGNDSTVIAKDENVFINDYGTQEWEYDIENFLIVPGVLDLKLSAPKSSNFIGYFFGTDFTVFIEADKRAEVLFEIQYDNTNWEIEFKGNILEDSIDYNPDTTYLEFTAAPQTDLINKKMLYDLNGNALNPLNYQVPDQNQTYMYLISKIINDIYKLINSNVAVEIYHDWVFQGEYDNADPIYNPGGYIIFPYGLGEPPPDPQTLSDLSFLELYEDIRPLFFDNTKGLNTLGDVLRKLSIDWCCYTGMIHQEKAFFRKLFTNSPDAIYDLDPDSYIENRYKYQLNLINYVRYLVPGVSTPYERGTFTQLEGTYLDRDSLVGFYQDIGSSFTNILAYRTNIYSVYKTKDTQISSSFLDYGDVIASLWYNFRSNMKNCRIDPIITPGINHSIVLNPRLNGIIYQPIRLKKYYNPKALYTEIDGMYLKTG